MSTGKNYSLRLLWNIRNTINKMDTRRFLFCCFQKPFSHMHSSVSTSARFLPLLVEHCCRGVPAVFTHEAHRRNGGVKIQSKNGDIFIKNRILINYSACVKGAWLTDVLNPRLLACFWADLRVEPEVDEPQHVTHVSFFLLSLFFLFFFKATACVLVYTRNVFLLWKLIVINWSFQVGRKGKTQKYQIWNRNGVGLFPVWAKTEISGCDI